VAGSKYLWEAAGIRGTSFPDNIVELQPPTSLVSQPRRIGVLPDSSPVFTGPTLKLAIGQMRCKRHHSMLCSAPHLASYDLAKLTVPSHLEISRSSFLTGGQGPASVCTKSSRPEPRLERGLDQEGVGATSGYGSLPVALLGKHCGAP
jgi:hypothetical protein